MQTISTDAYNCLVSGHLLGVTISCDGIDGNRTVTDSDIVQGSFTIDRNSISGTNIEIGNVEISELKFSLDNFDHRFDDFRFEGAVLTVDLLIGSETLRVGEFIVDEIPKKLTILSISALDYMAKFDKPVSGTSIGGMTLAELLNQVCTACGVTLYTQSFLNGTYSAPVITDLSDLSYRQIVSWIAELSGNNAWIDSNGELRLSWYGENQGASIIEIGPTVRREFELDENAITLTGIVFRSGDTENVLGTNDYALVIEGNSLLNPVDAASILGAVQTKITGFSYRPFSFTTSGFPHLWPMDEITTVDANGQPVMSFIMNHRYRLNGLSELSAQGESLVRNGYASLAPFTARQREVLKTISSSGGSTDLTPAIQAAIQLNEVIANAHGFYTTVVDDGLGGKIVYDHDAILLADSTVIYKKTASAFAWTDTGWNNGNPVWTNGYTASGNILAKTLSVIGLNATWINAGSIISNNFTGTGDGSGFSATGMRINLQDGTISAPKFRIDTTGAAEFSGKIDASIGLIGGWTISSDRISAGDLSLNSNGSIFISPASSSYWFGVDSLGKMTAESASLQSCTATSGFTVSSGTFKVGGSIYYCTIDSTGSISTNGDLHVGGTTYYCDISSSGAISTTSSLRVGGDTYYANINSMGAISTTNTLRVGGLDYYTSISSMGAITTTYNLTVDGTSTLATVNASGTATFSGSLKHTGTSVGFYNTAPTIKKTVSNLITITATGTADTTYSSNEVTLINALKTDVNTLKTRLVAVIDALKAYGLN